MCEQKKEGKHVVGPTLENINHSQYEVQIVLYPEIVCNDKGHGKSFHPMYILRNTVFLFATIAYSFLTDCILKGLDFL